MPTALDDEDEDILILHSVRIGVPLVLVAFGDILKRNLLYCCREVLWISFLPQDKRCNSYSC